MTESAAVFNQTSKSRAKLGRNAYHKKGGSATTKLGNKPMTDKEIASRHGPVVTYDFGFITYDEFKKMSADLEAEYVNKLCSKYAIRMSTISEYLFEAGEDDLMARLKILGVYKDCPQLKTTAVSESAIQKFKEDVDIWREKDAAAKVIDLSEAQRKRSIIENGEFVSYEEYKAFSDSEKVDYINQLVARYDVGRNIIAKVLFEKSVGTLDAYLKTKNLSSSLHTAKSHVASERQAKTKAFENAVKAWKGESVVEEKTVAEPVEEKSEFVPEDILAAIIGDNETVEESKKAELPESNISAFYVPVKQEEPDPEPITVPDTVSAPTTSTEVNSHSTVFSANYKSIGMDCDELDALKLMFKNKSVEVCISVRTI